MGDKTIAFSVTDTEYQEIEALATKEGMSVPQYAKAQIIDSPFKNYVKQLLQGVEQLPTRSTFTVRSVLEDAQIWKDIPQGQKKSLGKHFFQLISEHPEYRVEVYGDISTNPVSYRKI